MAAAAAYVAIFFWLTSRSSKSIISHFSLQNVTASKWLNNAAVTACRRAHGYHAASQPASMLHANYCKLPAREENFFPKQL